MLKHASAPFTDIVETFIREHVSAKFHTIREFLYFYYTYQYMQQTLDNNFIEI